MRTFKGQKGLSLVEVTIMLLVLMLLTSVLAPSIFDFVTDAQRVKVKEDCEAIGLSIARLARDVGPCLIVSGTTCDKAHRADLLFSDGPVPAVPAAIALAGGVDVAAAANVKWDSGGMAVANTDSLERQLVSNGPLYKTPVQLVWGNQSNPLPHFNTGWRGAYVAPPIGPDPYGHQYIVNSIFLSTASDAIAGGCVAGTTVEGCGQSGWSYDTVCISAGKDGIISTPFFPATGFGTTRLGDDFIYVISGGTR